MTIVPNIFKIDKTHGSLRGLPDTMTIIRHIILRSYQKRNRPLDQSQLRIPSVQKNEFTYYLYQYRVADKDSDWSTFLPNELKEGAEFQQTKVNLVLFMETEHELFAIVGGSAYWLIANFIDHLYGLLTYDKIISLEEDEATSTKSRGMTGQRAGLSEQYRDNYRMINYLQFGKIPKELHIRLSSTTSDEYFSFLLAKTAEKLQIVAGAGFKINKEVDFEKLHQIVGELSTIMTLAPKDYLSSYIHIRDRLVLEELNGLLREKIYNNIPYLLRTSIDPRDIFEFDFCNPNKIEAFYEADHYDLVEKTETGKKKDGHFATVYDKAELYRKVIERAYELNGNNEGKIIAYLYGVNIQCYVGNKQTASSGFMFHFNAEFSWRGDAVFLVDGKWYLLKDTFVESLMAQTERIMKSSRLTSGILSESWTFDTVKMKFSKEGSYNMLYDNMPGYIVCDTVIIDGVELCDILHITANEVYLIHVKHSFTSRVRELTNQILISARRLSQAISAKQRTFFNGIYDALVTKGRSVDNLTSEEFYNLFLAKKPIYVFATASQLAVDLAIQDNVALYDSNIARFSLVTCSAEMQTSFYELKTFQITRA
ncbi:uncharacterized protein (TIGR04141 family) [Pedobacter duraquae]|uniref:Uncharacterized protein (TIGR04141 family) n=1 Tax=Pedobacter duraquae TaxID=425511 RepID=A0A4R6INJ1_9SPHI|nr:uncharacterized protein (TIGR04141 family) [Pedobacter duraquae]